MVEKEYSKRQFLTKYDKFLAKYFAGSKDCCTFAAEKRKGYEHNLVQKDNKE